MNWTYNANEVEKREFELIPIGDHRVRIADIVETTSKNGNDMLKIILNVSGFATKIWYYLTFLPEQQKMTNTKLFNIYKSFGIPEGDMDFESWIGKMGAARIKHETYNGDESAKISYFINGKKAEKLPAWVEKEGMGVKKDIDVSTDGFVMTDDANDDVPF